MDLRKYKSGAAASPPIAPETYSDGYPAAGNPATSTPATKPGPWWFHQISEELRAVLLSAGVAPDPEALTQLNEAIDNKISAASTQIPIGAVFEVWDHIVGVDEPDNSGSIKYIKLTAGEDGVGQYNNGLVTGESVSGVSPDIIATAVISYASSPMNGQTVRLINTSRQFLRPGLSGVEQDSKIKAHSHTVPIAIASDNGNNANVGAGTASIVGNKVTGSTGDDETSPRTIGATYYMRIA